MNTFFHGEEPKDELRPSMVIFIGNCGLYIDSFGVRVEDTVTVTKDGYDELIKYKRTL